MRVLIFGHAYAASYNRVDKLARIAKDPRVEKLGVVIPKNWQDRMMEVDRSYKKVPEDDLYRVYLLNSIITGIQSKYFFCPLSLLQIIKEFKPDLIHVEQELHDWVLGEVILLNSLFWHVPTSVFIWENLRRQYGHVARYCRQFNLKRIDALIAGNEEALEIVREDGFKGVGIILPQFGVNENFFCPHEVGTLRQDLDLEGKFVISFVGRYVQEKGIHTLIQAIEKLTHTDNITEFSLLLLSSMEPPDWLKEKANTLKDKIYIIGNIPHEDFPRYVNLFDILVLPSETQENWKEQFGRVIVEAMACGVPVIGSSSGAIPEIIGDYGLVFQEKDAQDLTNKLLELINNPRMLSDLKGKVREYVMENYTHDKVVEKTINTWQELLNK